jgi:DNA/RNA-binding domain of Phe-tRNA-synthetase-like protein
VVHATGLTNGPSPHELLDAYRGEQQAVAARLEATPIAELPSIAAWRQVFSGFGAKPTQYRNAAEALLRRLSKQGDIPSISMLVDVGNLVSIRYGLPVAVLDSDSIADGITVRFANGDERFSDLGSSESDSPDPGEVIFIDGDGVVSARRWCWRQSALTATGPATVAALFVVEGHHDTAAHDVAAAVNDLTALLATYQPKAQASSFELPSHGQRGER